MKTLMRLLLFLAWVIWFTPSIATADDKSDQKVESRNGEVAAEEDDTEEEDDTAEDDSEEDSEDKDDSEEESKDDADEKEKKEEKKDKADKDDKGSGDEEKKKDSAEEKKESASKDDGKKKEEKESKPKTHEVKASDFRIEIDLTGVFAAEKTEEISVEAKSWSRFKVKEVVEHGAQVDEGDVLIEFDDEDYRRAVQDMRVNQQIAEFSMMQAEQELERLEKSLEMAFDAARRRDENLNEDHQRYEEVERDLLKESWDFMLKTSKQQLEYQEEELNQLEQMYAADELTEETEEIILKRQRATVERAKYFYEQDKLQHEKVMKILLPRSDESRKDSLEISKMSLERAKMDLSITLNQKRLQYDKTKTAHRRTLEKNAELVADEKWFTINAPTSGVVYYGKAVNGKWSGTSTMLSSLKVDGSVSPKSVFMTIVQQRPLMMYSSVPEKSMLEIDAGDKVTATPTADENATLDGKITEVSSIPLGAGQFQLKISLDDDIPDWVVAGMNGKVKVTAYESEDALTVPTKAVKTDDEDEDQKYVMVVTDEEEEAERREIETGKTSKGSIEVLKGLEEGDKILLDPDSAKDEKKKDEE